MKSISAPKGQKNPQNTLPKIIVSIVTARVTIANPGITDRDAMKVRYPVSGLMRRNHLVSMLYASGKLIAMKNENKKRTKKNVWE
jgi:hypothetical protein